MRIGWNRVHLCSGVQIIVRGDPPPAVEAEATLFAQTFDVRELGKPCFLPNLAAGCLLERFAFIYATFREDIAFAISLTADEGHEPAPIFGANNDATCTGAISGAFWLDKPALINRQEKPPLCGMQHCTRTRVQFTGSPTSNSRGYDLKLVYFADVSIDVVLLGHH